MRRTVFSLKLFKMILHNLLIKLIKHIDKLDDLDQSAAAYEAVCTSLIKWFAPEPTVTCDSQTVAKLCNKQTYYITKPQSLLRCYTFFFAIDSNEISPNMVKTTFKKYKIILISSPTAPLHCEYFIYWNHTENPVKSGCLFVGSFAN